MARSVAFYFDFLSPYAFFAARRIGDLCAARDVEVALHPVLFAALLGHHGQLGPAEIPSKRRWTFTDVARIAALAGIELRGPPRHPFVPLLALRICTVDRRPEVMRALFDACWVGGADLEDPTQVAAALDAIGCDGADLVAKGSAPEAKAALRAETEAALEAGVFGVPTMITEAGALFWGHDRLDHLALHLDGRDPVDLALADTMLDRPGTHRAR